MRGQRESSLFECTTVKAGGARRYFECTNLERKVEGMRKEGWEEESGEKHEFQMEGLKDTKAKEQLSTVLTYMRHVYSMHCICTVTTLSYLFQSIGASILSIIRGNRSPGRGRILITPS